MTTPIPPSDVSELRAARRAAEASPTPDRLARLYRAVDAVLGDLKPDDGDGCDGGQFTAKR